MSTTLTTRLVAAGSAAAAVLAAGAVAPGAALADDRRGTTTVVPSETTKSVLLGVLKPARLTSAGAEFPITSAQRGRIAHVGGLTLKETDSRTAATSLTLRNLVIDSARGTVSAVVDGGDRAVVFTLGSGGTLLFTSAASRAITGGDGLVGASAGTAKVALKR